MPVTMARYVFVSLRTRSRKLQSRSVGKFYSTRALSRSFTVGGFKSDHPTSGRTPLRARADTEFVGNWPDGRFVRRTINAIVFPRYIARRFTAVADYKNGRRSSRRGRLRSLNAPRSRYVRRKTAAITRPAPGVIYDAFPRHRLSARCAVARHREIENYAVSRL